MISMAFLLRLLALTDARSDLTDISLRMSTASARNVHVGNCKIVEKPIRDIETHCANHVEHTRLCVELTSECPRAAHVEILTRVLQRWVRHLSSHY